jgi:hypothetical protein
MSAPLFIVMPSAVMMTVALFIVMLSAVILSVTFSYCYAECHHSECRGISYCQLLLNMPIRSPRFNSQFLEKANFI